MIHDLLFSLRLNIPSSLAHSSDADNITNKNRGIIKGKSFRLPTLSWFQHQYRIIVIGNQNLRAIEFLVCPTNSVDFVAFSSNI